MDRQQCIDGIEWLAPDSGTGFGVCAVGHSLAWSLAQVQPEDDLKSVIVVKGPPDKYTDRELLELWWFSHIYTKTYYDEMFIQRVGANLIIFDKKEWGWLRKRMSWDVGTMYSPTMGEALSVFDRNLRERPW